MQTTGTYSIWLVPAKRDGSAITAQIELLAKKFYSFVFTPHITMYRIKNISLAKFVSLTRSSLDTMSAIDVQLAGLQIGNTVNRTLYYPVLQSQQLRALYSSLHDSLRRYGEFPFDPHISILYKRGLTEQEKKQSQSSVIPIDTVHFSKAYIIQSVVSLTEGSDVPEWSVIHEQLLY